MQRTYARSTMGSRGSRRPAAQPGRPLFFLRRMRMRRPDMLFLNGRCEISVEFVAESDIGVLHGIHARATVQVSVRVDMCVPVCVYGYASSLARG